MSSSPSNLPIGHVIGSRYRIQSLIGRGGMGMVYSAVHELTARRVALKLMISHGDDSPVVQERFLGEARIAAAVRHPHIVDVLDMGIYEGVPFLVMELLEGVSLDSVLEKQKLLPLEKALAWLLPIMGALAVLHDAEIVHRDVKPSNIFLSSLPRHPIRPKLLDFGLARTISDMRLTRSGTVIGTPLYMAPEHAAGQATGPQSDVWSIGVVLYEAIAGTSPFTYTDRASLAAQVIAGRVRPLAERRPDIPELVSAAVDRALQADPARRYPDMRAFARALYLAARESGVPVPADPDPVGLPQLTKLQPAQMDVAITHDLPVPTGLPGLAPEDPQRTSRISARVVRGGMGLPITLIAGLTVILLGIVLWTQQSARQARSVERPAGAASRPVATPMPDPVPLPVVSQPTVESLTVEPPPPPSSEAADAGSGEETSARGRTSSARRGEARRPSRPRTLQRVRSEQEPAEASRPSSPPRVDEVESEWK